MTNIEIYSAYLPYGVKVKDTSLGIVELTLTGFTMREIETVGFTNNKLILKPLSDIIKDKNVFTKLFIKAAGINYDAREIESLFDIRQTNHNYYLCTELNRKISVSYCGGTNVFRVFNNEGNNIQIKNQYDLFQILLKNHYDVFGLIDQGKAINYNEL